MKILMVLVSMSLISFGAQAEMGFDAKDVDNLNKVLAGGGNACKNMNLRPEQIQSLFEMHQRTELDMIDLKAAAARAGVVYKHTLINLDSNKSTGQQKAADFRTSLSEIMDYGLQNLNTIIFDILDADQRHAFLHCMKQMKKRQKRGHGHGHKNKK